MVCFWRFLGGSGTIAGTLGPSSLGVEDVQGRLLCTFFFSCEDCSSGGAPLLLNEGDTLTGFLVGLHCVVIAAAGLAGGWTSTAKGAGVAAVGLKVGGGLQQSLPLVGINIGFCVAGISWRSRLGEVVVVLSGMVPSGFGM